MESKKTFLEKLKYFSSLFDLISDIVKSFATIIASIGSAITAMITGYFEIRKVTNPKHIKKQILLKTDIKKTQSESVSMTTQSIAIQQNQPYKFDMNSGGFVLSLIILGVLIFSRFKKTSKGLPK